jgi:SAM-dependent methyltransferase
MLDPKDYWEKRLEVNFNLSGVGYSGMGKSYNFWLYKIKAAVFQQAVRSFSHEIYGFKVLDVGTGTGFGIKQWEKRKAKSITGIDFTNVSIKNLKEEFPNHNFLLLDITKDITIALGKSQYDAISAIDVLFHIIDDNYYKIALKNIYELLQPGGRFIFSDNFLHHTSEQSGYQISRSLDYILRALVDIGFEVIYRRPMFILMNDPIDQKRSWLRKLWQRILMCPFRNDFLGIAWGLFLYPLELILTQCLKEGPTTELMICKKPS